MKNKLLTLAGALALVAVLGKFYAIPLVAQVRAALVKNLDEKGRNPYQADSSCTAVFPNVSCSALLPVVPAGKRLVIEYVNGEFVQSDSFTASFAALNLAPGVDYALPVFARFSGDYGVTSPVLIYVEAGQQARFTVSGTVSQVHVTGYLVDLAQ